MTAKITTHSSKGNAATAGTIALRSRSASKPSKINYLRALVAAFMITGGSCGYCGLTVSAHKIDRDGRGGMVKIDLRRAVGRQVTTPHGPRRDADAMHLAHVLPVCFGGTTVAGNVFLSHRACNLAAGETDHTGDARLAGMVPDTFPTGRQAADGQDPRVEGSDPSDMITEDTMRAARRRRGWPF